MKRQVRTAKKLTAAVLTVSLLAGSALALSGQRSIDVVFNNIKILVDGKQFTPTDAKGNVVEPFAYNGTTYLPVRAIAEALGQEVGWDSATSTVTIGSTSGAWLDTLSAYSFDSTSGLSVNESFGEIKKNNVTYERGVRFLVKGIDKKGYTETSTTVFLLNGQYETFTSTLLATSEDYANPSIVKIYGDNTLLYTSPGITKNTIPLELNLQVQDVQQLKIEISVDNNYGNYNAYRNIYFAEAILTK